MKPALYTLPNGLRLLLVHNAAQPSVSVLVMVDAGSFDERPPAFGVAHFLEHMSFKGTPTYPRPGEIACMLEGMGAASNAFTGRHETGYWAKVEPRRGKEVVRIIADLYLNPLFLEEEIEKERGVVMEELKMYKDHPRANAPDVFNALMYGDTPAGRPIIGFEETVASIIKADLVDFREKFYHPEHTVVAISGAFDPKEMRALVKELFGRIPQGTSKSSRKKPTLTQKRVQVLEKKSEQSHLVLGVRGLPVGHPQEHALAVLGNVLGGGMSSRLFQRIREEMGAAYYVSAGESLHPLYGEFTIHAGVPHGRVEEVISAIFDECKKLVRNGVSNEELDRVKNYTAGLFLLGLESSEAIASYYAGALIEGEPLMSPALRARAYRAVTAEEVQRLARTLLVPAAFRVAVVGPWGADAVEAFLP